MSSLVHLVQRVLAGLLVLLLLLILEPRGPVFQVSGEDGLGAIDQKKWAETRGLTRGRSYAPDE